MTSRMVHVSVDNWKDGRVPGVAMMESPLEKARCTRKNVLVRLQEIFQRRDDAQEGLTTTTACRHEVQGRELAGDRHVNFSIPQFCFFWAQKVARRCFAVAFACWRR